MCRPTAISEAEAIRRAEHFISANGFTDLTGNRPRLASELVVYSSSADDELTMRHDTLERKADGVFGGAGGWVVYFRYKHRRELDPARRRAVVMNAQGGQIRIIHQDAY